MINKLLRPWPMRILLYKMSKTVVAITLALTVAVVAISIYMNNVGNFVISVEKSERLSISLSENNDFINNATSLLYAAGLENMTNATYMNIPGDVDDVQYNGDHNDHKNQRYSAYSFYLKNTSPIDLGYTMTIEINQVYKDVDAALRVMVITDGEAVIYAKRNDDGSIVSHADLTTPYETEPFYDNDTICYVATPMFMEGEVVRYTVVMWLEGWDPECTDAIKGGAIRMSMKFAAQ